MFIRPVIGGGGPAYNPGMMTFDGSTGMYQAFGIDWGKSDVVDATHTAIIRIRREPFTGDDFENILSCHSGSPRVRLAVFSSDYSADTSLQNKLVAYVHQNGGTTVMQVLSNVDVCDGDKHLVFLRYSYQSSATAQFVIDGADADDTGWASRIAPSTGTVPQTNGNAYLSTTNLGGNKFFGGDMGYMGYANGLFDYNDFMDGSTPKEIDKVGWSEFGGVQPYFWSDTCEMDNHDGSFVQMTKSGTITGPSVIP